MNIQQEENLQKKSSLKPWRNENSYENPIYAELSYSLKLPEYGA